MKVIAIVLLMLSHFVLSGQDSFSLTEAMDYAIQNHNNMKLAELRGTDAEWQYKEALAIGMPQLNGNLSYSYYYKTPVNPVQDFLTPAIYGILAEEGLAEPFTGEPNFFEFGFIRKNQLNAGLSVEAMVFDGNYLKGLRVAKQFIQLSKDRAVLSEQTIRQNVARAYQNVLVAERNMHIIEDNIANVRKTLEEAKVIFQNGFIEQLDVDRLELSLENLTFEKDKLEKLILINYNILKYEMAYPLDNEMRVADNLEDTVNKMILDPVNSVQAVEYDGRPEHRILKEALALDYADLDRIKMGYYPTIKANVNYDQTLQRDRFFDRSEAGFLANGSIGLRATIPIYDGGDTKAKIQRKKIVLSQREIELREFERGMELQVRNARTNFQNAKWTLESSQRSMRLNEKIYDKTQIKYREGVGSSVEVTQAEASLYQSQANYINALYDLLVAKTELDIATGELLKLQN